MVGLLTICAELVETDGALAHRPQFVDFSWLTAYDTPAQVVDTVDSLPDAELGSFLNQVFSKPDRSQI